MNADGYMLLAVNVFGDTKDQGSKCFAGDEDLFPLAAIKDALAYQLPEKMKNVLVMCFYKIGSEPSYDYHSGATEFEVAFDLISYTVMQDDYKEFHAQQVTMEINEIGGLQNLPSLSTDEPIKDDCYTQLVREWETFHHEEFKPYEFGRKKEIK